MSRLTRSLQLGHGQSLEVSVTQASDMGALDWASPVMGKGRERLGSGVLCLPWCMVINLYQLVSSMR